MIRKVTDLNKTAHNSKRKPVSKRRLQYLLHKSEVSSHQYKAERDTLIDDIAVLKANISRLELENENQLDLLQDFNKFINYKLEVIPANATYKHYRSELDKLGVK